MALTVEQMMERWGKRTVLVEPSGCWLYMGSVNHRGYAVIQKPAPDRGTQLLHRFVVDQVLGVPEPGLVVDHECHNESDCTLGDQCWHRRCWNPDHLTLKTDAENKRASSDGGRHQRTHCVHGHEFTEETIYYRPDGGRSCKACWPMRRERRRLSVTHSD